MTFCTRTRNGYLWVVVVVRDPRWRLVSGPEKRKAEQELFDARFEIVDPASGRVVAAMRHDGPADEPVPFSRFLTGRRSYRVMEDSVGLRRIEIFDIHLIKK